MFSPSPSSLLKNIFYVACARRSDGTTVAAYGQKAYADEVAKLISSPGFRQKTKPGARTSLTSKNGTFHMLGNKEGLVVVVVPSTSYPSRTVYSGFCEDVFHQFQSKNFNWQECEANKWSSKFKGNLALLCKEYDDPSELYKRSESSSVTEATTLGNEEYVYSSDDEIICGEYMTKDGRENQRKRAAKRESKKKRAEIILGIYVAESRGGWEKDVWVRRPFTLLGISPSDAFHLPVIQKMLEEPVELGETMYKAVMGISDLKDTTDSVSHHLDVESATLATLVIHPALIQIRVALLSARHKRMGANANIRCLPVHLLRKILIFRGAELNEQPKPISTTVYARNNLVVIIVTARFLFFPHEKMYSCGCVHYETCIHHDELMYLVQNPGPLWAAQKILEKISKGKDGSKVILDLKKWNSCIQIHLWEQQQQLLEGKRRPRKKLRCRERFFLFGESLLKFYFKYVSPLIYLAGGIVSLVLSLEPCTEIKEFAALSTVIVSSCLLFVFVVIFLFRFKFET